MKVLFVVPAYEPAWAFGGVVTATSQLCRALTRQGIDVTVYTTDDNGKGGHLDALLNRPVSLGGVKTWYFRCDFGLKKPFYSRVLAKKLKETIRDFDLVHVSAIWQWLQFDVYRICKLFSKPYIVSTHGVFSPWPWNQKAIKKRLYWYFIGKRTMGGAAAVHFNAEDERAKSFSTLPFLTRIPSFIVPNGVDIHNIKKRQNIRKSLGISDDRLVLLFIGRIHKVKGIHFVLEALKKLNDEKFIFLIVGHQEDANYMRYLIKLSEGIRDSVIWHKSVDADKVWDYYNSSDLFVLPSYNESFSMAMAEAMACGLPVLTNKNVGTWQEIQSDNAGFIIDRDVSGITDVLKNISKDTKILSQMSQNAKKTIENRYNIDKIASLMVKGYEEVLSGDKSSELQWK